MAYNEALVIAGGVAHVPILITILKFFDGKTSKSYNHQKSIEAVAKKKALEEAQAAKAKAETKKAAEAKAQAEAKAKAEEASKAESSNNEPTS
ncbi:MULTISPECIES: hypothetical protein [Prochlorococcus]|uniref:hypothetical protein n=1 Tax=Prochlorococcus TaxID=1218 RepID=UPI000533A99D|nr:MULTISPECIES: hypothetical protein [Prochlorococcus]KGG12585.1 hypothetical protein EV05_1797 [Prochlorococcus sp. MIT 0601]